MILKIRLENNFKLTLPIAISKIRIVAYKRFHKFQPLCLHSLGNLAGKYALSVQSECDCPDQPEKTQTSPYAKITRKLYKSKSYWKSVKRRISSYHIRVIENAMNVAFHFRIIRYVAFDSHINEFLLNASLLHTCRSQTFNGCQQMLWWSEILKIFFQFGLNCIACS